MACTMQYLEQCLKLCGTSSFWEFIVCLGIMLMEILRSMRNSTTTISTISHYKFHQGNHGSSILYLLLFQKIKLCVVGFFFLFLFFLSYIELSRPWKVDQELKKEKKKKRNHLFRDISFTLFFFSYYRVFLSCRVLVIHDRTVKDPR